MKNDSTHPALEEHEERHEGDRDRREHDVDHALRESQRRPGDAEELDATGVQRLPGLVDKVVLGLEEPEPTAALRQVVQVVRNLPGEVVHLIDERRDEEESDPDGGAERER
jgi:hypothetical protein